MEIIGMIFWFFGLGDQPTPAPSYDTASTEGEVLWFLVFCFVGSWIIIKKLEAKNDNHGAFFYLIKVCLSLATMILAVCLLSWMGAVIMGVLGANKLSKSG